MSLAVDLAAKRISSAREEGFRPYPYDDATGLRVHAPKGNITEGYGFNCDAPRPASFWFALLQQEVAQLDADLSQFSWYSGANDVRRSVFLDIAFNQGLVGLMHYPSMIHYASIGDWTNSAAECTVKPDSPPGVIARYKQLSDLLLCGVEPNA